MPAPWTALEAVSFAALNIGGSLLLSYYGVVQLNHRSMFRRLIGFVLLWVYCAFALTLNLALAHYREIAAFSLTAAASH